MRPGHTSVVGPSLPSAAKFAVMQNAASTSREGDDVIAPRVEGRVARH